MIIELRRIFLHDEQKCCDSNALKELKIRLRHHIPQTLQGKGAEFQEIFESLVHDGKITLGNYEFLHNALTEIEQITAANKIKDYQLKIQQILSLNSSCEEELKMISGNGENSSIKTTEFKYPSTSLNERSYSSVSSSSSGYCLVESYRDDSISSPPTSAENSNIYRTYEIEIASILRRGS
ncbi:uncharacterized protein LOC134241747 [Saccostrea cucullata]|uniref:uncharacterized protein LOC134241747 n=1 Tax=Saccostrea cuccullata TaxID=36930 RepID=UPI002ED012F5